ncbi:MAG: hypothetical protein LH649_18460 [Pseudanabaena sp. CAN_BIN31]|nr:hypothetical protein [Pseudanabaena sp. CAN_BIN31]
MSDKEQLIYELDRAPDFLVREALDFFLFIKTRTNEQHRQKSSQNSDPKEAEIPSFLSFIDQINAETEANTNIPKDLAKNLDHYLYGIPKEEA